jgi:hypothetical protein
MAESHRWKFYRSGGVDQVALRDGRDVVRLAELDPKLWVALAMPVKGNELDARTLNLLDADKDGRVRLPEILAATRFVDVTFKDPDDVMSASDTMPLASFKDAMVQASARRLLDDLGKKEATSVSLADVKAHGDIVSKLKLNGDGVLPADAVEDAETRKVITEILATVGGVDDRGGQRGVSQASIDTFFGAAQDYVDWHAKSETDKALLPLGDGTGAAAAAVNAVRAKIDDYFARCRLAAFDARAGAVLNGTDAELEALGGKLLGGAEAEVAKLPLAKIEAGRPLSLKDGLNPAWAGAVATLQAAAVTPLLRAGQDKLSEADWSALTGKLAAHDAWASAKPTSPVERLGVDRLKAILAGQAKATLAKALDADKAVDAQNREVVEVERALCYKRHLLEVLSNYVNFSRFYQRKGAAFQAGSLVLDGRRCDLCLEVSDAGKHGALAGMAAVYLAYCDITRPGEKKTIVAAFTAGDSDNLFVGRNGVFYDRAGRDWDATITKVIDNPISVRQAFWAPYKKLARMIEEQVAKRASAKEAEADALLGRTAEATAHVDQTKAAPPAPPPKKFDVGTVAALGVAIGGIGTFLVGIFTSLFGLGLWLPLALIAIMLAISAPSVVLAWLKLRRRNLGPILDANGWAVNGRARINVPFGGALTEVATLPKGAERSVDDPFADKKTPWALYLLLLVVVAAAALWFAGQLDRFLPEAARHETVFPPNPPAPDAPAAK